MLLKFSRDVYGSILDRHH